MRTGSTALAGSLLLLLAGCSAEQRICRRMGELCGTDAAECRASVADLRKALGEDAMKELDACYAQADSCAEAKGCERRAGRIEAGGRRHGDVDRIVRTVEVAMGNARGAKGIADGLDGGAQALGGDIAARDLHHEAGAAGEVEARNEAMIRHPAGKAGGKAGRKKARQKDQKARRKDEPEGEGLPAGG